MNLFIPLLFKEIETKNNSKAFQISSLTTTRGLNWSLHNFDIMQDSITVRFPFHLQLKKQVSRGTWVRHMSTLLASHGQLWNYFSVWYLLSIMIFLLGFQTSCKRLWESSINGFLSDHWFSLQPHCCPTIAFPWLHVQVHEKEEKMEPAYYNKNRKDYIRWWTESMIARAFHDISLWIMIITYI